MKEDFVQSYFDHAEKAQRQTGIPALFALAQSALESGWGKHAPGNMLFGMKVGSGQNYGGWKGEKQLLTTTEYSTSSVKSFPYVYPGYPVQSSSGKWQYKVKDYFRAYPSPLHSLLDWAGLLTGSSRYQGAMQTVADPYRFAEEIAKAGYATAPDYADKVKAVMQEIAGIIETKGLHKKSPWRIIIPLLIVMAGSGLIIYGVLRYRKGK